MYLECHLLTFVFVTGWQYFGKIGKLQNSKIPKLPYIMETKDFQLQVEMNRKERKQD